MPTSVTCKGAPGDSSCHSWGLRHLEVRGEDLRGSQWATIWHFLNAHLVAVLFPQSKESPPVHCPEWTCRDSKSPWSYWGGWGMNPNMKEVKALRGWPAPLGDRTWQDTAKTVLPFQLYQVVPCLSHFTQPLWRHASKSRQHCLKLFPAWERIPCLLCPLSCFTSLICFHGFAPLPSRVLAFKLYLRFHFLGKLGWDTKAHRKHLTLRDNFRCIPLRSEIRQGWLISPLLFNTILLALTNAKRHKKELKGKRIIREEIKLSLLVKDMLNCIENPTESINKLSKFVKV